MANSSGSRDLLRSPLFWGAVALVVVGLLIGGSFGLAWILRDRGAAPPATPTSRLAESATPAVPTAAAMADATPSATPDSGAASKSATPTSTRAATSTPIAEGAATESATPTPTATASGGATATATPTAAAPVLVSPLGLALENPVEFVWRGALAEGQAYRVVALHIASQTRVTSYELSETSWQADLPVDRYGEWRWWVEVVRNGGVLVSSELGLFWLQGIGGTPFETAEVPTTYTPSAPGPGESTYTPSPAGP